MKKKALTVLLILTAFLAMGFLAGTTWSGLRANASVAEPPPPPKPERPKGFAPMHIASLLDGIELDEVSREKVRGIELELDTSMKFFREEFMTDMKRINEDIDAKLIAMLDDEQKSRFKENKRRWEERIRSGFGRRGPGKGGPGSSRMRGSREHGGDRGDRDNLRDWRTKADIDKDGDVSEAERTEFWDNYWATRGGRPAPSRGDWYWILRNFEKIDADKDGQLSEEECRKAKDESSSRSPSRFGGSHRGPGGGRPPGPPGPGGPEGRGGFIPNPVEEAAKASQASPDEK